MTRNQLITIAGIGSAILLLSAFSFQYLGYAPCKMCLWQRWPHGVAIALSVMAITLSWRVIPMLGALAAATTSFLGFFHSGVEQKWWEGPSSCSGGGSALSGVSGTDLLATQGAGFIVMCDEISWSFAGLSMPTWNGMLSLGLVILWAIAVRIQHKTLLS